MTSSRTRVAAPLAALLLAGCAGGQAAAAPATPTSVTSAAAAPVTSAAAPATSAPTSVPAAVRAEDPVAVQRVRPCRARDVRVTGSGEGATSMWVVSVELQAGPGVRCRLGGYPDVALVTRGGTVPLRRGTHVPAGTSTAPFVVREGRPGTTELVWSRLAWCPPGLRIDRIDLRMPGGGTVSVPGFGRPRCDLGTKAGAPVDQPVHVGRFLPMPR